MIIAMPSLVTLMALFVILTILFVVTPVYVYKDAIGYEMSRKFAVLSVMLVIFFPVVGFIVYLFIKK